MSTTEKQAESNRQNAQHSTGPKTAEGKAKVGRNAVKHGLYSNQTVLNSRHHQEDRAEYDRLLQSVTIELLPETSFQHLLVKRIVDCLWRLRRAVTAETAQIHRQLDTAEDTLRTDELVNRLSMRFLRTKKDDTASGGDTHPPDLSHPEPVEGSAPDTETPPDPLTNIIDSKLIPDDAFSKNLLRYELRLNRELIRTYELFNHLKLGGISGFIESKKFGRSGPSQSRPHRVSKKIKCFETNPDDL
jgi:hypothetical protein